MGAATGLVQELGWQPLVRFTDAARARCTAKHGKCSHQSGKHWQLEGSNRTRMAAKFTESLAKDLAIELLGHWPCAHKHGLFLDIFGGSGAVGMQLAALGFNCLVIDKAWRKGDDVCNPLFSEAFGERRKSKSYSRRHACSSLRKF